MPTGDMLPEFEGKVVVLYVANAPAPIDRGVVLEFASFQTLGGRLFVVGRSPSAIAISPGDWVSNLAEGVAWDSVVSYVIFDSREDFAKRTHAAQKSRRWFASREK